MSPPQPRAPGVLAVLTGADWRASGLGDLPVPGGLKRRDGSPMYRPRYPALVLDRVRWVGDYVAFVVAETLAQAADAAELDRGGLRAVARHHRDGRGADAGRAAASSTIARTTSASSILKATRPRPMPLSRRAAHVVRQHFVINRVTAVTMEPRGSIGDYNAADGRYTIYTTLQRGPSVSQPSCPERAEGAGDAHPRRRRRYRRQLRHEIRGL